MFLGIKKNTRKKAFSLIELSILILIIGIIVAGVLASNALIKKFRITTAQTLTQSSPVNGIPDSVLWLESSLDKSFKSSESDDTSSLSAWYDIRESANKNSATQTNSINSPTYSNSINYIQAVKFDGTNGYFNVDGSVLNNTNYTIFVLEQRESNKSGNYFIGDSSSANQSTTNKNLVLGYSADGTVIHSQSSDNSYSSSISTYAASSGKPRIFTFVHDKSSGKKTYINGLLAATSADTNNLSGMTTLTIGKSYQGQIGEVVMFARSLNDEERQSIEDYLGKKWNSTILRSVGLSSSSGGVGGSCTSGIVSTTGCQINCTVPTTSGISATSVGDGSGSLTCSGTGSNGASLTYSCSNGVFSFTGTVTACGCATGYSLVGSSCVTSNCTGGTVSTTTISGTSYTIHTFTSSDTFSCPSARTAQVLVVGGGGSGGCASSPGGGGGGGGGGVVYAASYSLGTSNYSVTVGAGGSSVVNANGIHGNNGGNSTFGTITGIGGGGGGNWDSGAHQYSGNSGGSGGGAGGGTNTISGGSSSQTSQSGETSHYGNAGGGAASNGPGYCGGGGGGAGSAGGAASGGYCGAGGNAISNSITGSAIYYGAGGGGAGGASSNNLAGIGGSGVGGQGGYGTSSTGSAGSFSSTGTAGNGGGGSVSVASGAGSQGIVIVVY